MNQVLVRVFCAKVATMVPRDGQRIIFMNTWQLETPEVKPTDKYLMNVACRDIREIDLSDELWVLSEDCEFVPGGMHFEAGYAYGQGKRVIVMGPKVHAFYNLPDIQHYANYQDFLAANFRSAFDA
jgi:nucleoside 2-deoxyribosyltransferase